MALESGTHIDDLVETNPTSGDPIHQVDDHLRLIKNTLKASLPGLDDALLDSTGSVRAAKLPGIVEDLGDVSTPSPSATQKYNIEVTSGGAVSLVESPFELFERELFSPAINPSDGSNLSINGASQWSVTGNGIYIVIAAIRAQSVTTGGNFLRIMFSGTAPTALVNLTSSADSSFVPVGGMYDATESDGALLAVVNNATHTFQIRITGSLLSNIVDMWVYIKRLMDIPTI